MMARNFQTYLLNATGANSFQETEVIQSLWSGYGKISRYKLDGSNLSSVVVKHIQLNKTDKHPRGWGGDFGHQRKLKSYQVEKNWYLSWNQECSNTSKTPTLIGSFEEQNQIWLILEDLAIQYPLVLSSVGLGEVKRGLSWLAHFHGQFMMKSPDNLWAKGTYWHLDTRPEEWKKINNQSLKFNAHKIDQRLNECKYQTIVHGDAKLANFCFSDDKQQIAAVDFQYVGGGCGMKDVAYFLGSCLNDNELVKHDQVLLNYYFSELKKAINNDLIIQFNELEDEWRRLYPYAVADFTRFMMGWMPSHQKINHYSMSLTHEVLKAVDTNKQIS